MWTRSLSNTQVQKLAPKCWICIWEDFIGPCHLQMNYQPHYFAFYNGYIRRSCLLYTLFYVNIICKLYRADFPSSEIQNSSFTFSQIKVVGKGLPSSPERKPNKKQKKKQQVTGTMFGAWLSISSQFSFAPSSFYEVIWNMRDWKRRRNGSQAEDDGTSIASV